MWTREGGEGYERKSGEEIETNFCGHDAGSGFLRCCLIRQFDRCLRCVL